MTSDTLFCQGLNISFWIHDSSKIKIESFDFVSHVKYINFLNGGRYNSVFWILHVFIQIIVPKWWILQDLWNFQYLDLKLGLMVSFPSFSKQSFLRMNTKLSLNDM